MAGYDNNKLGELRPNQIITTFGPGAVSYTHLDVSKRQPLQCYAKPFAKSKDLNTNQTACITDTLRKKDSSISQKNL